jgi:hypothetical protein
MWRRPGTNPRLENLMMNLNLNNLNEGNKQIFVISNRKEVTDLALRTNDVVNGLHPIGPTVR